MVTDRTTDQYGVTVTYMIQPEVQSAVPDSDAGCGQVQSAAFSASQHLGIARHDLDASLAGGAGKADDDTFQLYDLHAFFDKRIQTQVLWDGSGDGEVVNSAMHSQRTDIAPGELQRLNGKAIGGEHHVTGIQHYAGCIDLNVETVIGKMPGKYFIDKLAHVASAVAVCQCNVSVLHVLNLLFYPYSTICPKLMAPSLTGINKGSVTSKPASPSSAMLFSVSTRFWNTPPARPTVLTPVSCRTRFACCSSVSAIDR
jgi:hypothetical protein